MSKTKIIILIVMLAAAVYLGFFKQKKTVVVDNPTLITEESEETGNEIFTDKRKEWKNEESDFYQIKYNLAGINEVNAETDIDRFVSDRVYQFKTDGDFENLTETDKEVLGFNRGFKYTTEFTYEIKESSKIKSYILKNSYFTGGAHGNVEVVSFNYDKESGRRLNLDDIFVKPSSKYLPVLSLFGSQFLNSEYEEVLVEEGVSDKSTNWSVWYTTNESIVFIFQTYQVAPYSEGIPEFEISADKLEDFIDEDYFIE